MLLLTRVMIMIAQVEKVGNEDNELKSDIDWYIQDYERPEPSDGWENIEPKGREEW